MSEKRPLEEQLDELYPTLAKKEELGQHPRPFPSPEAALEVAHNHQEEYERMTREGGAKYSPERMHHALMAENNSLLAIAGFLAQQHVCGHGTRGWCPNCHQALKEGTYTP